MTRAPRRIHLAIVAVAFAGLGLPDGAVGVAWPSMRQEFALPVSSLGSLLLVMMAGHLLASLASGPAAARVGSAHLLLGGILAYTVAAGGLAVASSWSALLAAGLLTGLAAGLLDAGLNAYAAGRFSPGALTALHACFGAGAALGPVLVGRALEARGSWRAGFTVIACALVAVTLAVAASRRVLEGDAPVTGGSVGAHTPRLAETLRRPGVWMGALLFCLYTGLEATPGRWAYSLFVESRGMAPERAAGAAAAYWGAIAIGRASWSVAARWLRPRDVLRACLACAPAGALLVWTGGDGPGNVIGLVVLGFCFAPIFPLLISLTPDRLGAPHAAHAIGLQVAAGALGTGAVPAALGLLARKVGLEVIGPFLFAAALVTLGLHEAAERRAGFRPLRSP